MMILIIENQKLHMWVACKGEIQEPEWAKNVWIHKQPGRVGQGICWLAQLIGK
jgi:hypothetical protein